MSEFNFDPSQVADPYAGGGGLLTPGKFPAMFTGYEIKNTKPRPDGTPTNGTYWEAAVVFLDGPNKNRQWTVRITKTNQNADAVTIGQKHIAQICVALGGIRPTTFGEFLNRPMLMEVFNKKRKDRDEMESNITRFEPMNGLPQAAAQAPQYAPAPAAAPSPQYGAQPAAPAAPAAGGTPAWRRTA